LLLIVTAIHYGTLYIGWELASVIGGLPRVLFSFCVGVALHHFRPAPKIRTGGAIAMAAIVVVGCFRGVTNWIYDLPMVLIIFPLTLYLATTWQPEGKTASVFRALGELSYPLYALHLPVIYVVNRALQTVSHDAMLD